MSKQLIVKQKSFMNTLITFKVVKDLENTVTILDAIEEGFSEFERIVKAYTRFNENSELSNLNRKAGEWVQVTSEFFSLINQMLSLANATGGAFDPTVIDFLELYGYDKNYDFSKLENPELDNIVIDRVKNRPSYKDIDLDSKNCKVKLCKDQKIDLGGIGKGYAIDCATNVLKNKFNIKNFLIDAGGDLMAVGLNEKDKEWSIGLKTMDDTGKEVIHSKVNLSNQALACSGSWARKVKQFHHLINPLTGKPQNDFKTIYVMASNATDADGWATALFVLGKDVSKISLKEYNVNYYAL